MEIQTWPINPALKEEADRHYRTAFALALAPRAPWEIISRLTFDGVAPRLDLAQVEAMIAWLNRRVLSGRLTGSGLELGAGAGFWSAVMARLPAVEKIYAVEVVENIVRQLGPKVTEYVLKDERDKVVGCVGEFDHLQLPDAALNFAFDFYSLHHSPDLVKTLTETARVLKPGGFLLCLDKARDNKMSPADLDRLLDIEYSRESKLLMGLPPDQKQTRRDNGEQEYRLKDWEQAFRTAGFSRVEHFHLAHLAGGKLIRLLKKIISWLPVRVETFFTKWLYKNKQVNNLEISNLIFFPPGENYPKEISLLIAHK